MEIQKSSKNSHNAKKRESRKNPLVSSSTVCYAEKGTISKFSSLGQLGLLYNVVVNVERCMKKLELELQKILRNDIELTISELTYSEG